MVNETVQNMTCRGAMRNRVSWAIILFAAAILCFQYIQLQDGRDITTTVSSIPGRYPPNNALSPPSKIGIPREFSQRRVYNLTEIAKMWIDGHHSAHSKVPLWPTKADLELVHAKSEMEMVDGTVNANDDMYPSIYQNLSMFGRSYELMEKTLKVYVYKEGKKPHFHQPVLSGTYASEGWFMKLLESNQHFVTTNPKEAHLFYIPFGSLWIRKAVSNSPGKITYTKVLKDYLDIISSKYPYWNRTGGTDHFFVACQDWFERITRHIMSPCIRVLCDADVYKPFIFGKDVSLPTTMIHNQTNPLLNIGGEPPSRRNTLAFYAGQSKGHGYLRTILMNYWEDTDPDIKVFGGSTNVNGSEAYISYMRSSKYCICPRGTLSFGPRFVEAIYFECVPVFVSDNYIPPFSDVLNWDKFSVFMTEEDIPLLKEKLLSIPYETYLKLHLGVKMVQKHFLWHDQPRKYDVFHMILHSVWLNRVFQLQHD